jgi:RimJ/RimL family protein N-acetyltransferase
MQPLLTTGRLILRPFRADDAPVVQQLAGDIRIARGTAAVPHPYGDGVAEAWIASHTTLFAQKREIVFAVEARSTSSLIGAVSLLNLAPAHARAELGFWIDVDYWSQGYCTEAVREVMRFAKESLEVTRFVGRCLAWNAASANVMKKVGLEIEGCLVKHEKHEGQYVDQLIFGLSLAERGR